MKDIQTIKKRLSAIQGNFNPQKNTYQVIEYVVNNDLTYNEMLMKLSEIKGFSKYPEELKKEYVSIINDIKESIINQRKKEEKEKQEANTKELKDIIDSLEKRKKEYKEQLDNVIKEPETKKIESDNKDHKDNTLTEKKVNNIEDGKEKIKKEKNITEDDKEQLDKIKKVLLIGIVIVILLITSVLLFY